MNKVILLLFVFFITAFAQEPSIDKIIKSGQYYYGKGIADNEKEATDVALSELSKNISLIVSHEFKRTVTEKNENINETVKDIISTYSLSTVTGHEKIINQAENGKIEVFSYLKKSEVVKLYELRKKNIYDIYENAVKFEDDLNLSEALKNYYFSIILMNSMPATQVIEFNGKNLFTEIPIRINTILEKTKFSLKTDRRISDSEREVIFNVSYQNKSVQLIEFTYWDGSGYVDGRGADGECIMRLIGSSVNISKITISIKYSYYERREEIKEVGELWNLVIRPVYKFTREYSLGQGSIVNNGIKENKENIAEDKSIKKNDFKQGNYRLNLVYSDSCGVVQQISEETLSLLELLKGNSISGIKERFSGDSFLRDKIVNLINYNNPAIIDDSISAEVRKTLTGWELRKIKVLNRYKHIKKQSVEYIILDFNNEGKLDDISFGVSENAYNKVQKTSENCGDWINRQTIMKFVEKYRTSFLCRDLSAVDSLFADKALIIIGRSFRPAASTDGYIYNRLTNEQPDADYIKLTKKQYLTNLSRLFKKAEDIFIGFSSMDIEKKIGQKVYGISMRQNYCNNSYSDEGYLFLLVDFEQQQPQIYIRNWQPKQWDEQALIKLINFRINSR